ncbi:hypothetical protein BDV96DRAFT_118214 [Lophiotrema nucula]|uniref:Zn(2)-C6 fungal-type domain-containing protein n=1 Tax=Lophiotrema nucula TaxID=690887 RepID=A0A6A5Z314_9PLEO|nr:hypothetical protein BDV96DRAFT_118214 [Lophiotrema nucula]
MFGVLQYDTRDNDIKFIERTGSVESVGHSACEFCRHKKLRCSGDSSGCERCKALSRKCIYPETNNNKTAKKHKRHGPLSLPSTPKTKMRERGQVMAQTPTSTDSTRTEDFNISTEGAKLQSQLDEVDMDLFTDVLGEIEDFQADYVPGFEGDIALPSLGRMNVVGEGHNNSLVEGFDFGPSLGCGNLTSLHSQGRVAPPLHYNQRDDHREPSLSSLPTQSTPRHPKLSSTRQQSSVKSILRACQCLNVIVSTTEDVEATISNAEDRGLDLMLASHKEALKSCQRLLQCYGCTTKPESVMLLTFVCDKLVELCAKTVSRFMSCSRATAALYSDHSKIADKCKLLYEETTVGEYVVSSREEWECLIRALVGLQLRSLRELIGKMKELAPSVLPESRFSKLVAHENKVMDLIQRMDI